MWELFALLHPQSMLVQLKRLVPVLDFTT